MIFVVACRCATKTYFGLNDLTDLYIRVLSPVVYSRAYKIDLPVWFVYRDIINFVEKAAEKDEKWQTHKDNLIGKDTIVQAPERYYDIGLALDLHIPLNEWDNLDKFTLRDKAEIRAQRYLQNMVDVVERHYKTMDENAQKRMTGNNDGKS